MQRVDAAIVGGGPAGSAAAIELAKSGASVILVDGAPPDRDKVGEALPPAVNPLLRHLGVWRTMLADGHRVCPGNESVWGGPVAAGIDFIRDPNGHGWHVDRARFDAMLRAAARAQGAAVIERAAVRESERAERRWRLALESSQGTSEIEASWVIDCSGRRSAIARSLGVPRIRFDALIGAVMFLRRDAKSGAIDDLTFVAAGPDGWWYTAAPSKDRRITAYFTDRGDRTAREARSCEAYLQMMAAAPAVHRRAIGSGYLPETPPRFVGAESSRLERFAGPGWVAAGDAAAAFDPLSSQGIFFALRSGVNAAQAVRAALLGDFGAMTDYAERLERAFTTYLVQRHAYYRAERRWMDRPFWRARHQAAASQPIASAK